MAAHQSNSKPTSEFSLIDYIRLKSILKLLNYNHYLDFTKGKLVYKFEYFINNVIFDQVNISEIDGKGQHSMRKYAVPKIETRFLAKRNSFVLLPENKEWVNRVFKSSGMPEEKFAKIRDFNLAIGYAYSLCDDITRFEKLWFYLMLFMVYDDHIDGHNPGQSVSSFRNSLEEVCRKLEDENSVGISTWVPYLKALYDVLQQICVNFNDIQKKRLINYLRLYNLGSSEEAENKNNKKKYKNLDEIVQMRNKCTGMFVSFQLFEYALNICLPEHIWESQIWQELLDSASTYANYINDLYSFEKELKESKGRLDYMANSVAIISISEGIPIEEAINKLPRLINEKEKELFDIQKQIMSKDGCLKVENFIESLNHMLGGFLVVHAYADRYNKFNY